VTAVDSLHFDKSCALYCVISTYI